MTKQLLTHSRMQSFKNCRRRHLYEYELGLRPETDAKALRMGSAGHQGIDVLNKTADKAQAIRAVNDFYYALSFPEDQWWEMSIEQETVECLIAGYHWRWGSDNMEVIASEQSFLLPLVNPQTGKHTPLWDLAGKIDGIIEVDGRMMVLEHKFISDSIESDSDYWNKLKIDSQISIYAWAARQIGHDVSGVLYDVIRKPTIKPTQVPIRDDDGIKIVLDADGNRVMTKDGKKPRQTGDSKLGYVLQSRRMTREEWGKRLLADIGERPEFYYARNEIARLDDDIEEMMQEVWDVQLTIRNSQKTNRWYKTVGHDNCKYCPFFGMCVAKIIPTDYVPEGFVKLDNLHPEL